MAIRCYLNTGSNITEILHLQDLNIDQRINEHATLYLTAKLQEKSEIYYVEKTKSLDLVEIVSDEPSYQTIFKGVVKRIEVRQADKAHFLIVEGYSSSFLADIEISSRSFQNAAETYTSICTKVIEMPFKNGAIPKADRKPGEVNDRATGGKATGEFVMQYRETDWQFIKRMASRFYHGLVPSLLFDSPKIVMGIPKGTNRGSIEKYNFVAKKDLERYLDMSENTKFTEETGEKFFELDAVTFFIETSEAFDIGDTLTYQYNRPETAVSSLYIKRKEIEMVDGALRYRYELSQENGLRAPKIYNEQIVGLSLQGVVLERIQDTVKVFLEIDNAPPPLSEAWRFPYTTPYTAEGSAG